MLHLSWNYGEVIIKLITFLIIFEIIILYIYLKHCEKNIVFKIFYEEEKDITQMKAANLSILIARAAASGNQEV